MIRFFPRNVPDKEEKPKQSGSILRCSFFHNPGPDPTVKAIGRGKGSFVPAAEHKIYSDFQRKWKRPVPGKRGSVTSGMLVEDQQREQTREEPMPYDR